MDERLLKMIVQVVNDNAFCSLSRDCASVYAVRLRLIALGLAEQTDKPYIGCIKTTRNKDG